MVLRERGASTGEEPGERDPARLQKTQVDWEREVLCWMGQVVGAIVELGLGVCVVDG
jgi:hypothetical protein